MRRAFTFAVCVLAAAHAARAVVLVGSVQYTLNVPGTISGPVPGFASSGEVTGYGEYGSDPDSHALVWSSATNTAVDLNPAGFTESQALGGFGTTQVGWGYGPGSTATSNNKHAMLWNGTATNPVDLGHNSARFTKSVAYATDGPQQVGEGFISNGNAHAAMWSGTAASETDLNPAGFTESYAYGVSGSSEVGSGYGSATQQNTHALLWTATGYSDLNPTINHFTFGVSEALGIGVSQQVGDGYDSNGNNNALLWTGTAASAVDLNPAGFTSWADNTNGTEQVGYGYSADIDYNNHALLWSGTASSVVDLQTMLPVSGTWADSQAYTIDSSGDVFGTADGTYNGTTGAFAVEWTASAAVPEPATASLFALAIAASLRKRRHIR